MSRAPGKFTQVEITKACKGAIRAGLEVQRVEFDDGGFRVVTCKSNTPNTLNETTLDEGEWD
jgi:hypothetical protein